MGERIYYYLYLYNICPKSVPKGVGRSVPKGGEIVGG